MPNDQLRLVGFIVNPIAGMGGAVGLKGTDGTFILEKAIRLGAKPVAPIRAEAFLNELKPFKEKIRLIAAAGIMGEDEAKKCGFNYTVIGERKNKTAAEDTIKAAERIREANVDILVFCGGDGTARDIYKAVDTSIPVIGVPTGVKMQSAVFAVDPKAAARIVIRYLFEGLPLRQAEVMDIDEEAFRKGRVSAELYGFMLVPYEPLLIQGAKMATPMTESELRNQAAIALYIIDRLEPDTLYIIGPGTTTRIIGDLLEADKTLLGVDIFQGKRLIAKDVNEKQILAHIKGKKAKIIVTPIGGQGFIFGRGNQQISPQVIRQVGLDNIIVIATKNKLSTLKSLRVDTGDPELDAEFHNRKIKVIVDYGLELEMPIE
ncbi:ATP-NAD kinase family protein [Candidatus Bathyarchaeota archaeon]|nr:ATP-NAD kinase family protein [Candidatus Bathyarchaeota archaeon]